jgi:hypothetical protein
VLDGAIANCRYAASNKLIRRRRLASVAGEERERNFIWRRLIAAGGSYLRIRTAASQLFLIARTKRAKAGATC